MKNCRCGSPRCLRRERWLAVLRPDGIRSACVGQPLHSRRSALSRDARKLNLKIKFRESFRPFAPAVMRDRVGHYFELEQSSPYMLLVAPVKPAIRLDRRFGASRAGFLDRLKTPRSSIPAVTHVDYSARVQTVSPDENPHFYSLLRAFEAQTGCAVLVNTSFNVRGEPPVCTPAEAFRCFMRTDMHLLGNFLLDKRAQLANGTADASP